MLKDQINLRGGSVLDIIMGKNCPEGMTPAEWMESVKKYVQSTVEPHLIEYLKGLNLPEVMESVDTVEELEKLDIDTFPPDFIEKFADTMDKVPKLSDVQKAWLFTYWLPVLFNSADTFIREHIVVRAEHLMAAKEGAKPPRPRKLKKV